jgi:hypothetical protein
MLPGFDGIEVCRQVRQFTDAYIIILTARDQELDKVLGLSMGADDYLVKPFSPREMIARIRAMLRRPRTARDANSPEPLTWGAIALDPGARIITVDGEPVTSARSSTPRALAQPRTVLTSGDRRVGHRLVRRRPCGRRPRGTHAQLLMTTPASRYVRTVRAWATGWWRRIRPTPRLATRLMVAQALVVGIGACPRDHGRGRGPACSTSTSSR